MDEEAAKLCIQDRLRSAATRAKEMFASWPIFFITILFLIFITLPEFLTLAIGRETIIPILSQISLEGRFGIFSSIAMILILLKQNQINKSFLKFEQERDRSIRRKEHDIMLVGEPLNSLRRSIKYYSDVITYLHVNTRNGEIFIPRMNITDRISGQQGLLHEHLNNGGQQLLHSILKYQKSYNIMVHSVSVIFKECMDLLVQSWVTEKKLITVKSSSNRFCADIMSEFKDVVYNRLFRKDEPELRARACIENTLRIRFHNHHITASTEADANQIVKDINEILLAPEVYDKIKNLIEEDESSEKKHNQIIKYLKDLQTSVTAGNDLAGWCSAGIRAKYEYANS